MKVAPKLVFILMCGVTAGCHSYNHVDMDAVNASELSNKSVEVTRFDHSVLHLRDVTVTRDSLAGMTEGRDEERVAVPLHDVQSVSVRDLNVGQTAALTGGVLLTSVIVLFGVAAALVLTQWH